MSNTQNLKLVTTEDNSYISFGEYRKIINGESNSNMTKIDKAYGDIKSSLDSVLNKTNNKSDKTTILSGSNTTLELANNVEVRYTDAISSLTLTLPATIPDDYISSVVFTTDNKLDTTITYPSDICMSGDSCINDKFVPLKSRRYTLIIWNDGVTINGIVYGRAVVIDNE